MANNSTKDLLALHATVWAHVFRSPKWLEQAITKFNTHPLLIGSCLDSYYNPTISRPHGPYMMLIAKDMKGDLRFEKKLFFQCLQPYKYKEGDKEVVFKSGIVLDIQDVLLCPVEYSPRDTKGLFRYGQEKLQLFYSFWEATDFKMGTLQSSAFIGTKGPITKRENLLPICSVNFTLPNGAEDYYIFEEGGCRAAPIGKDKYGRPTRWHI